MILVKLQGGLGNQLFQYAVGRALSWHHKVPLYLDTSFYTDKIPLTATKRELQLASLDLRYKIADKRLCRKFEHDKLGYWDRLQIKAGIRSSFKIVNESKFEFDDSIFRISNNLCLKGYWQSEKYFDTIKDNIRKDYEGIQQAALKDRNLSSKISNTNSVSIHFRRGDYVLDQDIAKVHGVLELDYYHSAISFLKSKIGSIDLFVFSDDIEWVKTNFRTDIDVTLVQNHNAIEDLGLMALCKHNILANSSFSWWGAWLNQYSQKIVVAPKNWFANTTHNTQDLYPESWIKL